MAITILITGGTGFAGSHLVEHLLTQPDVVIHVTNISDRASYVHQLLPNNHIHQLDLTDATAVAQLLNTLQPQQIYHLASAAAVGESFTQARQVIENHVTLQLNLLEAVKLHCPQARVLAVGSALEYALNSQSAKHPITESQPIGPVSPYAVSKAIQTLLAHSFAKSFDLPIIVVRPFNHIGERQGLGFVVADLASQIVKIERGQQTELKVGNLAAIRDFSDVKDVVKAYAILMAQGVPGETYNLGSGQGHSIQQILDWLTAQATCPIPVTIDQALFRPLDIESVIADNSKVRELGWTPVHSLQETLQRVVSWWRSQS